jgi:arabinofuranosyltransferase
LIAPRLFSCFYGAICGRRAAAALYLSSAAYATIELWRYPHWIVDDAYIVFRYAKHLIDHGQLTWTVGSDPVEGYTGIVLPLLVAGGMRLGFTPERVTLLLGILSLFLAAWTLSDNQRRLGVPEPVRAYVTATTLLFPPLLAHATSGLETLLFAATLGASLGTLLECDASPRRAPQARLWLELLLLSLLRPEGLLFAAAFGGVLAVRLRRGPGRCSAVILSVVLFALPYGAYFLWRVSYYGRLLPNTYYAKAADGFDPTFVRTTLEMVDRFLPALVAGAALALLTPSRPHLPRRPVVAMCVAIALLSLVYSRSTMLMGYLYRFQVHFLFLLLPFLGVILANLGERDAILRCTRTVTGAAATAFIAVCLVAWPIEFLATAEPLRGQRQHYLDVGSDQHARIGAWLRDHLLPSESIACWVDAGRIPFLADAHKVIDFGRLNDEYLARPSITREQVADYFFAARPGALVITSDSPTDVQPEFDGAVVTGDPRFAQYEWKQTLCSPEYGPGPCEMLFLRRDAGTR